MGMASLFDNLARWLLCAAYIVVTASVLADNDTVGRNVVPRMSPKTASGVVAAIRQYFRSDCVYFITSDSLVERHHVVSTQKTLGQQRAIFTKTLPYQSLYQIIAKLRFYCNVPIYVMFSDNQDISNFLKEAADKTKLSASVWLLVMLTATSIKDTFRGAYIPFDTEFIVARQLGDESVQLVEVYHVSRASQLTQYDFSVWTANKGMRPPEDAMYNRRGNLDGVELRVADYHIPPVSEITTVNTSDNRSVTLLGGFSGEIWKILESNLNFTSIHALPVDGGRTGVLVNVTIKNETTSSNQTVSRWDGMIGMLLHNESDVIATASTMSSERERVVKFSLPLFTSAILVYLKKPDRKAVNWSDWLAPFSLRLWVAFLVQVIISAALMVAVCWLVRRFTTGELDLHFYDEIFIIYGAIICQQGKEGPTPRSWSCRILFFLSYIAGVILISSYSGSVISNLTVYRLDLPFNDLEGLLKHGGYQLGAKKGSSVIETFKTAKSGLFFELYNKHIKTDPKNEIDSDLAGFQRVCEKEFAFISNPEVATLWRPSFNCNIVSLPQVFVKYTASLVFPKGSPYLNLFNNRLLKLTNDGVLRKIYKKFMFTEEPIQQNIFKSIVLEDVTPMLVIVAGGAIAGWLLIVVERAAFNYLARHPIPKWSTIIKTVKNRIRHLGARGKHYLRASHRRHRVPTITFSKNQLPKALRPRRQRQNSSP